MHNRMTPCCLILLLCSTVHATSHRNDYDDDYYYGGAGHEITGRHGGARPGAERNAYSIYSNKVRWRATSIANRVFALKLYSRVASAHPRENILLSPLVVSTGLSMTLLGAEGITEKQLMKVLQYSNIGKKRNMEPYTKSDVPRLYESLLQKLNASGDNQQGDSFVIACRLFGERSEPFLPEFIANTKKYYGAELEKVDFSHNPESARNSINSWVRDRTHGTIAEALPAGTVDSSTLLALASAAYFKGTWKHKFDRERTEPRIFHKSNGANVTANFMRGRFAIPTKYSHSLDSYIVILPYDNHGSNFSIEMQLFLPRHEEALRRVEALSNKERRRELRSIEESMVEVLLPKFRIDFGMDLADTLVSLGLDSLFGNANLAGMNGKRNLGFASAMHKGFIEVDEEGTTASASFVGVTARMAQTHRITFDSPFFFVIREKTTNSFLFMGRVENPE